MSFISGFIRLVLSRLGLFIYLLALIVAGALFLYIFPVTEIVSGVIALAESSALSSVVSFAQWIVAEDTVKYTVAFMLAAPLPLALLFSVLFAGALGSFAAGMERVREFPAKTDIRFSSGYKKRFLTVFILAAIVLAITFLLTLVWIIATIPLAIINALAERGALSEAVYNTALAVTALIAYVSLLFIRVYPASFLPALYSGSHRPCVAALSFAGRNFFKVARYFIITDVILVFLFSLYSFFGGALLVLMINCLVTAAMLFFLLYAAFDLYAADGYGYDEIDGETGYPAYITAPSDGYEANGRYEE